MPTTDTYTADNVWTVPAGVTEAVVELWGGGGAGVGDNGSTSNRLNGGGGGAYSKKTITGLTPGNEHTVIVGQGGIGVQSFGAAQAGEDSIFYDDDDITELCKAKGGQGGKNGGSGTVPIAYGGQEADGIGDIKYSGGDSPSHSDAFQTRPGGGGAGDSADGGDAPNTDSAEPGGTGGTNYGGNGGGDSSVASSRNGKELAGGGGCTDGATGLGGHGFRGEARITYTASAGYTLALAQGSYTLTGQALGMATARMLAMAQGAYTLTGQAVSLLRGFLVTIAQGSYVLTGQAVSLVAARLLALAQGSYTLTGQAVSVLRGFLVSVAQGAYVLAGIAVELTYSAGAAARRIRRMLTGHGK